MSVKLTLMIRILCWLIALGILGFIVYSTYLGQRVYWCGTYGHGMQADQWGRCVQLEELE